MIRKLNNKGMTAIEILITFAIVVVIVVSMYDGIMDLKNKETVASYKLSLTTYKNLLTKDIQDDLIKVGLSAVSMDSMKDDTGEAIGYRIRMTLRDGSIRLLEVKQIFGCNAIDSLEADELCIQRGIDKNQSDDFSISYGPEGNLTEYPLPDLGHEEMDNFGSSGTHTIYSLRINEVDVSTANNVFSVRIVLYHPDMGTEQSIDIVSPINLSSMDKTEEDGVGNISATIRENNSEGDILENKNEWTNKTLWFGEFRMDSENVVDRFEYSDGCTGNVSGILNTEGVTFSTSQDTRYCIRGVDSMGQASEWSTPYYFRIDKTPPEVTIEQTKDSNDSGTCYVKENGKGKTYDCSVLKTNVDGTAEDKHSGINAKNISCSAVTSDGGNWTLKQEKIDQDSIAITPNIPTNLLSIAKVTCKYEVTDKVGNSNAKTTTFNIGNGWSVRSNTGLGVWNYYNLGKKVTGWQRLYWYNPAAPAGAFNWYYFYDGTETASKNGCSGEKYEMARGWCKEIGGYSGWYYFNRGGLDAGSPTNPGWFPDGSMFSNGSWWISNGTYTFDASGRCVSGNGCY